MRLPGPWQRSFLGFTVKNDHRLFRRSIADKAVARFKRRVRAVTWRHRGVNLEPMIGELVPYLRGWAGYFSFSQSHELPSLDGWIRRRLRCVVWVQWKTRGQRYRELRRLNESLEVRIVEQKLAEKRIQEQAALLDKAQDAISVVDLDDRILYWNQSAERLYGWSAAEALGRKASELLFRGPTSAPV